MPCPDRAPIRQRGIAVNLRDHRLGATLALAVGLALAGQTSAQVAAGAPQMRQATINGITLSYEEQGHGAPVVFVHGSPGDHRSWDGEREAIARDRRFIA